MNQTLLPAVIDNLMSLLPVTKPKPPAPQGMTKREKLQRWADIVRNEKAPAILFHNLEHYRPVDLKGAAHPNSVFALAGRDRILQDQGIKQDIPANVYGVATTSAAEAMRFFELSQAQLHEFSCDCGGAISATQMADRIEGIARRA